VYLTYPFVLGWSCMEALSAGCLVVGSRTAPVEEAIAHGKNGVLVDFFDVAALSAAVCEALARPQEFAPLRSAARQSALDRYDLARVCLPQQVKLVEGLLE
jgi:glycosyltransferase involved in cell wall biosynthesis